jgi:hypothetical protein
MANQRDAPGPPLLPPASDPIMIDYSLAAGAGWCPMQQNDSSEDGIRG